MNDEQTSEITARLVGGSVSSFHAHPPMCGATREGRQCDLIRHYGGLHMWLNARPPLVVSWGYVNSDDTNPSGAKP